MNAVERIKAEVKAYEKNLKKDAKSRWRHGYVDGLKQALKWLEQEDASPSTTQNP